MSHQPSNRCIEPLAFLSDHVPVIGMKKSTSILLHQYPIIDI